MCCSAPVFATGAGKLSVVFDRRSVVHCYAKCQLTGETGDSSRETPSPRSMVPCTAIICHERRYSELVARDGRRASSIERGLSRLAPQTGGREMQCGRSRTRVLCLRKLRRPAGAAGGPQATRRLSHRTVACWLANNRDEAVISADLNLLEATGNQPTASPTRDSGRSTGSGCSARCGRRRRQMF
jgi:hypothetical protein